MRCCSALVDVLGVVLAFAVAGVGELERMPSSPLAATQEEERCQRIAEQLQSNEMWAWASSLLHINLRATDSTATAIHASLLSALGTSSTQLRVEILGERIAALDRRFGQVTVHSSTVDIERRAGELAVLARRLTPLCTLFSFGRPDPHLPEAKQCIARLLDVVTGHSLRYCCDVLSAVALMEPLPGTPAQGDIPLALATAGLVKELTSGRCIYYYLSWNTKIALWRYSHSAFVSDIATLATLAVEDLAFSVAGMLDGEEEVAQPPHVEDLIRCICEGCVRHPLLFHQLTSQLTGVILARGNENCVRLLHEMNSALLCLFEDRSFVFPYSRRSVTDYYPVEGKELVLLLRLPVSEDGLGDIVACMHRQRAPPKLQWTLLVMFFDWLSFAAESDSDEGKVLLHWFNTGQFIDPRMTTSHS